MDNHYDNILKKDGSSGRLSGDADTAARYTDPNAGVKDDFRQYSSAGQDGGSGHPYGQRDGYDYSRNYNYNDRQNGGYQDNYSYNTGNGGQDYEPGQDTSPMSMGDWLLTMLVSLIPCVGFVLYIVWAFSKTTNVNRRNFCRAQLVIMAVVLVVYIIFIAIFGTALFGATKSLYY